MQTYVGLLMVIKFLKIIQCKYLNNDEFFVNDKICLNFIYKNE